MLEIGEAIATKMIWDSGFGLIKRLTPRSAKSSGDVGVVGKQGKCIYVLPSTTKVPYWDILEAKGAAYGGGARLIELRI